MQEAQVAGLCGSLVVAGGCSIAREGTPCQGQAWRVLILTVLGADASPLGATRTGLLSVYNTSMWLTQLRTSHTLPN